MTLSAIDHRRRARARALRLCAHDRGVLSPPAGRWIPARPARGCARRRSRRPPGRCPGRRRRSRWRSPARGSRRWGYRPGSFRVSRPSSSRAWRARRAAPAGWGMSAPAARPAGSGVGRGSVPHVGGPPLCRAGAARAVDTGRHARSLARRVPGASQSAPGSAGRRGAVRVRRRHQPAGAGLGTEPGRRRSVTCSSTATSCRSARCCSATRTSTGSTPTARWSTGEDDRGAGLPPAEDAPELRDLGRNGSYLVVRQLRQDVQGFWQFLHRQANGDPRGRARSWPRRWWGGR